VADADRTIPGRPVLHETKIHVYPVNESFWGQLGGIVGFFADPFVGAATTLIVGGLATWLGRKVHKEYAVRRTARHARSARAE
jgi:hypothetical protein